MHDVLDIIKNVQSLYAVGPTLSILKDFERVIDELDVYVFQNWADGELLSGPVDSRHFVTCSFMWPEDKMPDPAGGKRLLDRGCKVTYKRDELLKPRKIKGPEDYRPGTVKGKIDAHGWWRSRCQKNLLATSNTARMRSRARTNRWEIQV